MQQSCLSVSQTAVQNMVYCKIDPVTFIKSSHTTRHVIKIFFLIKKKNNSQMLQQIKQKPGHNV